MSHQGNDGLVENQKQQSKRKQFESDGKLNKGNIKKKSNKKAMKKSKMKHIKKAAEQSIIDAIRKLDENCSVEQSKITVINIKKSPSLMKTHRKIKDDNDL